MNLIALRAEKRQLREELKINTQRKKGLKEEAARLKAKLKELMKETKALKSVPNV